MSITSESNLFKYPEYPGFKDTFTSEDKGNEIRIEELLKAISLETDLKTSKMYPVNGHHPLSERIRVYPKLGQRLSPADVGQKFVRVFPHRDIDWSYIPGDIAEEEAKEIIEVSPEKVVIRHCSDGKVWEFDSSWNDGCWTPVAKHPAHSLPVAAEQLSLQTTAKASQIMQESVSQTCQTSSIFLPWSQMPYTDPWYANTCAKILQVSGQDYSFQPPKVQAAQHLESDLTADTPHAILGLSVDVRDLKVIKARWQSLALQHHPDKGGIPENFRKIDNAYRQLKKELEEEDFSLNGCDDVESALLQARPWIKELLEREKMPFAHEYPNLLKAWHSLHQALMQVKLEGMELMLEDEILDIRDVAGQKVKFWEFRNKLSSLNLTTTKASAEIVQNIARLKELAKVCDLKNKQKGWTVSMDSFMDANMIFLDKLVANYRSLAEIYIVSKDMDNALAVRRKVERIPLKIASMLRRAFIFKNKTRVQKRMEEMMMKDMEEMMKNFGKAKLPEEFETNFEKLRLKSKRKTASSPDAEKTTSQGEKGKKPSQKHINESKAIVENLQKNLAFFIENGWGLFP